MKVKLMVDSTFNLSEEYVKQNNIEVIPLNVIIDGTSYLDGKEITVDEVIEAVENNKKVTTSQPTPYLFSEYFKRIRDEGFTDIICMTISSTLSGTFQAANIGKHMVEGVNIHLIDSLSASIGAEMLARIVVDEMNKNTKLNEIITKIEKIKLNAVIVLNMDNLSALKNSGRIGRIKATIGTLLRVKPMIEYVNGVVSINSKLRTESQVINWMVTKMKGALNNVTSKIHIFVAHIKAEERIKKLINAIKEAIPNININLGEGITPVISTNIGIGGIGLSWCYE